MTSKSENPDSTRMDRAQLAARRQEGLRLLAQGLSAYAVARLLGVSDKAARIWKRQLADPLGDQDSARRDQALALLRQGLPIYKVARQLHINASLISLWRRALVPVLPRPPRRRARQRDSVRLRARQTEADRLLRGGASRRAVCQALQISATTLLRWKRQLGLRTARTRHPQRDEAERLMREGLSAPKTAARLGLTPRLAYTWRAELRLPRRVHPQRAVAEALLRQGLGVRAIGGQLGVRAERVRLWAGRLGVQPPLEPRRGSGIRHPQRDAAEELLRGGARMSEVSRQLGISVPTVTRWRNALGLTARRGPGPEHPRRAEAEQLLREGLYPIDIAESLKLPAPLLERWRKALGLPRLRHKSRRRCFAERMLREGRSLLFASRGARVPISEVVRWRRQMRALGLLPGPVEADRAAPLLP